MATKVEELMKLVSEGKLEEAGKLAREEWGQITSLDSTQRESLLASCAPADQSLVWLAVLSVEVKQPLIDWSVFIPLITNFSENFSPEQARLHPQAFCDLIHQFTENLCVNRKAILGINSVRSVVQRYPPNEHTLTAVHSDLIQLCLAAKCLKPCLPYLARNYTELLTEKSQFDSKYVVLYFYYGGMTYTCLHDYLRALQLFTMCLCVPAIAVSAVMLAAYKKYILVCLLKYNKMIQLPKCASHLVERVFKSPCGHYLELAKAYATGDHRVVSQLVRHNVQRLTMSFITLSLEDAAQRVDLSDSNEMEKMLRDMIEDGDINACINQKEEMIVFSDDFVDDNCAQTLEARLKECMSLQQEMSKANDQLSLNPRYIQKSGTSRGGGGMDDDPFADDQLM
ncbi:PREDICTED: COP9 signalosome complex subunit 3-like [Amphimedon queenslandica]|uniref:COP9 signalosome complex subunit 3 n=2 Tax=Amphimedon queenslandica TaxID=400682 RepID=A0AAN0JWV6_AMPQE|nr:PREDICTED: COP9 signalosome complex subunit 3-like [Amphimedon queenslandica]|eukprot:XP_019861392.1 PREDICTED: COP9 signalosome complex subunit 3-like [Amphimedon queenslandica]